jgi:hypothetical protein
MLLVALALAANTIVQVDGRSFRVETKSDVVRVFQKATFTKVSLKARVRMREAVRISTGCRIVDDYWNGTRLEGTLDCTSRPSSP